MNRRDFLKGCAGFSALAATRGFGISNLVFADQLAAGSSTHPKAGPARSDKFDPSTLPPNNRDLLVFVFVRGGMDGLNVVVPFNTSEADRRAYYNTLRPTLNIPAPNSSATRKAIDLDGKFALHPDAARGATGVAVATKGAFDTGGLYELFRRGDLAIVEASGSPDITGSHFDTELYVDHGGTRYTDGWLTRYLRSTGTPDNALVVAPEAGVPPSLGEWYGSAAIPDPDRFGPLYAQPWNQDLLYIATEQRQLLQGMFSRGTTGLVEAQGLNALTAYDMLNPILSAAYTPAVPYLTDTSLTPDYAQFGNSMKTVARLAKANLTGNPLRVACVDVGGGWDTHDNEGTVEEGGRFSKLLTNLSSNLKAFCDDMNADPTWRGHYTVAVVSEFGRVMYQNDSGGCDHGAGNTLLLIGSGGNVHGGKVYGNWPGLQTMGFNDGLPITTDYRKVLAEVLNTRMGATADQINTTIFPGLNYSVGAGITGMGLLNPTAALTEVRA